MAEAGYRKNEIHCVTAKGCLKNISSIVKVSGCYYQNQNQNSKLCFFLVLSLLVFFSFFSHNSSLYVFSQFKLMSFVAFFFFIIIFLSFYFSLVTF